MLIRENELHDVFVDIKAYWIGPDDGFTTPPSGIVPDWYQAMLQRFFEHEGYNLGREVPKQAIIDYIDEHYPEAIPHEP